MDNEQAVQAANMYAEGASFADISRDLEVSKSSVGGLLRTGIGFLQNNRAEPEASSVRMIDEQRRLIEASELQDPPLPTRQPEVYTIETEGIGKRLILTAKSIMIYDLFRAAGFTGDRSDFANDSFDFMYIMRRPGERGNYR